METYEKVAKDFSQDKDCVVANVDATAATDIAEKFGVQGYPTIKFFPKGAKESPIEYSGGRSEEDFVTFLNEKCGTHRTAGGGLAETVCMMVCVFGRRRRSSSMTRPVGSQKWPAM